MSREVDELFGGDAPKPRVGLVAGLVASGVALSAGGLGCSVVPWVALRITTWAGVRAISWQSLWGALAGALACSVVPGIACVLVAWAVLDREIDRVEGGYLPLDARPRLDRLLRVIQFAVVVSIGLLMVQSWLFFRGYYHDLWSVGLDYLLDTPDTGEPLTGAGGSGSGPSFAPPP